MHARSSLALARWLSLALAACSPTPPDAPADTEPGSTSATTDAPGSGPGMTSTSGATSGADTSSSGPADTGVDFLVPGDYVCMEEGLGGGMMVRCTFECDVSQQDCPAGDKCMPWANDGGEVWNASRCSPIAPEPVPPGGTCTVEAAAVSGIDDCALGSMCWAVDPATLQGTCKEFCDPLRMPSETCAAPAQCVPLNSGEVPVCVAPCDPLQPACPEGEACRHVEDENDFYCLPLVGGHVEGSSQHCAAATCLPAELCVPAAALGACEAEQCCTALCDTSDPGADAQCAALDPALVCVPFFEPGAAPAGLEAVGVCIVPM